MITIRALVSQDREIWYEMMQKTGIFSVQAINLAMELVDTYLFNSEQKEYQVVVGLDSQEEVVAFACYGPVAGTAGTFRLHWLVVTPACQHHGIGAKLLDWVERKMQTDGARLIVIEITSDENYATFINFFIKHHYKQAGRIKNYYRAGEDMLFYIKYLV